VKAAVVCTSIGDGSFVKPYAEALRDSGATMIVIPDKKSPAPLYEACGQARHDGLQIWCPPPEVQDQFLERIGAPPGLFPWNTDHRRNVGYLMACESGAEVIISVDDDNLPGDGWLAEHEAALGAHAARAATGLFWNPCDQLICTELRRPWPRGFPYSSRKAGQITLAGTDADVAINEGLWIGDPDVDAITRLALGLESKELISSVVLGPETWAPVNSQNTAIRREVLPAYYFFRSGRFGDIYQGYLAEACAKAMGHTVRFGTPAADCSVRNDHDLLHDLQLELPDIVRMDDWLEWLTSAKPATTSYADAYQSLAFSMEEWAAGRGERHQLQWMAGQMRMWLKLCQAVA